MTERNRREPQGPNNAEGNNARPTPSQAEGDRDTINEDLQEKQGGRMQTQRPANAGGESEQTTPSQAEGDRETIERDIDEKLGGQQ